MTEQNILLWYRLCLTCHPCEQAIKQRTYHPGFAAEVVDGEERVNTWNGSILQTDHQIPEILSWSHAVGMLSNEDKIWLDGSGTQKIKIYERHHMTLREIISENRIIHSDKTAAFCSISRHYSINTQMIIGNWHTAVKTYQQDRV